MNSYQYEIKTNTVTQAGVPFVLSVRNVSTDENVAVFDTPEELVEVLRIEPAVLQPLLNGRERPLIVQSDILIQKEQMDEGKKSASYSA